MTQHIVVDIFATGESKECGILQIAAVSFDPIHHPIENHRTYFADNIDIDSVEARGYVFPISFRDLLIETDDTHLLNYLKPKTPYNTIGEVIEDFYRYLMLVDTLGAGNTRFYVLNINKAKVLLNTLYREGYVLFEWLHTPSIFIPEGLNQDTSITSRFDLLHNVNVVGGNLYKFLRKEKL